MSLEEAFLNWLIPYGGAIATVWFAWFLYRWDTRKLEERREIKERERGLNNIAQHLVGFSVIATRFKQFDTEESMSILRQDLENWITKFETLFSEYSHLNFMPSFMANSQYIIARVEYILRESLKRGQIIRVLNLVNEDIKGFLGQIKKLMENPKETQVKIKGL